MRNKYLMLAIRINKYLASKGYSTRRGADELIKKGLVLINGKAAVIGAKVGENDVVEVLKRGPAVKYLYFAYNKPVGIVTHSPQEGESDIKQKIKNTPMPRSAAAMLESVFPIGRLDKNSGGLIILTNDGRITDRLLNPENAHEKEYLVRAKYKLRPDFERNMEAGVDIRGYVTKKCAVAVKNSFEFTITLTEGKKNQIRRMCKALHNDVAELKRVRIMNIKIGGIAPGGYREITGGELGAFLKELGL